MASVFETVSHSKKFPAKIFVTQIDRCDFHWHYDYELILVLKGTVTVYSGAEPCLLSAGNIIMFNSRVVHGVQRTASDNLCLCMQFSPAIVSEYLDDSRFYHYFYLNSTTDILPEGKSYSSFASDLARIALMDQQLKGTEELRTYGKMLEFVADIIRYVQHDIRRMPVGQDDEISGELYSEIVKYVSEHLQSPHISQDLCRTLGVSEKTLYRYLKGLLGITLKELVDITRIDKARQMLREGKKTIAVIWESCGYSSEVSFYRNFKKQMNVTPNEFRRGSFSEAVSHSAFSNSYTGFNLGEATELLLGYCADERF